MPKTIVLAAVFVFLCGEFLWAGVYFESRIHSDLDHEVRKSETFISGTKMKNLIDGAYGHIIDLASKKLWSFDLPSKTYYEISLEEMSKEFNDVGSEMKIFTELYGTSQEDKELREVLKDDPEDESRFGEDKPPLGREVEKPFEPLVKRVRKKKKFLGYDCFLMEVDVSPTDRQEFWVTREIPYTQEVLNFWKAFYRTSSMPLNQFDSLKKHFEAMSRLDGFFLARKARIHGAGPVPVSEEETVVRVEERSFGPDIFELPKDMKKIQLGKDSVL